MYSGWRVWCSFETLSSLVLKQNIMPKTCSTIQNYENLLAFFNYETICLDSGLVSLKEFPFRVLTTKCWVTVIRLAFLSLQDNMHFRWIMMQQFQFAAQRKTQNHRLYHNKCIISHFVTFKPELHMIQRNVWETFLTPLSQRTAASHANCTLNQNSTKRWGKLCKSCTCNRSISVITPL